MKVIVITGASSGIGLATAKYLTQKGFKVYAISRSKVFEKNIKSIQADVTDFVKLQSAYQDIFEVEGKIDVLINNAGMGISGSIEDTDPKDAQYLMDVNFMGVFNSTKAALPLICELTTKAKSSTSVLLLVDCPFPFKHFIVVPKQQ
jgi:NADP-dependent 3-hydroxy acid dehydrogenase YdfG